MSESLENYDEPFQLIRQTERKPTKKPANRRQILSKSDLEILAKYIHREEYTREELAKRFRLTMRQLRSLIKSQGWGCKDGEDDAEDNLPIGIDPVPCPYPPGSEGKIWQMSERYARRLELFHPKDRFKPLSEAEINARKPKRQPKPELEPTPEELDAIAREEEQWHEVAQQSQCPSLSAETSEKRPPINSQDSRPTVDTTISRLSFPSKQCIWKRVTTRSKDSNQRFALNANRKRICSQPCEMRSIENGSAANTSE